MKLYFRQKEHTAKEIQKPVLTNKPTGAILIDNKRYDCYFNKRNSSILYFEYKNSWYKLMTWEMPAVISLDDLVVYFLKNSFYS